jgi:predicted ATPase/DNA-binding SARP family transcriptional activator
MEARVLGPIRATVDGREVDLGPPGQRRLFAALLVRPGYVVTLDTLADVLWGPSPPATARNILHGYVSALRRTLEPGRPARSEGTIVRSHPNGYLAYLDPQRHLDTGRFEQLAEEGRAASSGDPARASALLAEAIALWRGPAFAEIADHPFAQAEAARLAELKLQVHEDWAEAELAAGNHERIVPALHALVEEHPLREPLWALLILALYRTGRQGDALRAYESACSLLRSQLGVEPGRTLRTLHAQILTDDRSVRPPVPGNVPIPPSTFVGREIHIAEVRALLDETRLLTLTGAGGVGKTRLGLRVADDVRESFPDGVWWIDLAPVTDPAHVGGVVSSVLPGPKCNDLAEQVGDRLMLIVLDNCEHVAESCAHVAWTLLRSRLRVKVLATSRTPLGADGELTYRVPSLSLPIAADAPLIASDAVRLFADRARSACPDFRLTNNNEDAVAAIVSRLDGIPLAIELAAACTRMLSPAEISAALDDRFALLRGGSRAALPRHQTLEASVDWSHQLLDAEQQALLRRLAVFAGSFGLAAARHVCSSGSADVIGSLSALVDHSLVGVEPLGARTRYRMLETIRQYAHRNLVDSGEEAEMRSRHLDHYLAVAERREAPTSSMLEALLERLEPDMDNIRAALDHGSSSGRTQETLRLASAAAPLWLVRGNWSELLRWLGAASTADDTDLQVRAKALIAASTMAGYWDLAAMHGLASQGAALARRLGDERRLAQALANLAYASVIAGDPGSRAVIDEAAAVSRRCRHDASLVVALGVGVLVASPDERTALGEECVAAARRSGSQFLLAFGMYHRARLVTLFGEGRPDEACRELSDVVEITRGAGEIAYLAAALGTLGHAEITRGNYDVAGPFIEESVAVSRQSGMRPAEANALQYRGYLAYATGDLDVAQEAFAVARQIWAAVGDRLDDEHTRLGIGLVAMCEGRLDIARAIFSDIASSPLPGGWSRTQALLGLARLARLKGDDATSASLVADALSVSSERRDMMGIADAIDGAAALSDGDSVARLVGAAQRIRDEIGAARLPAAEADYSTCLARIVHSGSEAAMAEGRSMAVENALAFALREIERQARKRSD